MPDCCAGRGWSSWASAMNWARRCSAARDQRRGVPHAAERRRSHVSARERIPADCFRVDDSRGSRHRLQPAPGAHCCSRSRRSPLRFRPRPCSLCCCWRSSAWAEVSASARSLLMLLGTQWYILFNVIAGASAIPSDFREVAEPFSLQPAPTAGASSFCPASFPIW